MSVATALAPWQTRWKERWKALAPRERQLVRAAAALVAAALLWWVAIAPAWRSVQAAPPKLDQLDAQLQTMQRLAGEVQSLRAAPAVGPAQSQAALKAASDNLGSAGRLVIAGDRATMTFVNANGAQVRDWLAEVRSAARARTQEANLLRGPQGYNGTVIVVLPGAQAR